MPKISALPPMTTPDGDDIAPVNDDSASQTKKLTLTGLKEWFQSLVSWISTAMLEDDAVTNPKINLSTSTDANGWTINDLGSISIASKTYSFENGSIAANTNVSLGSVNAPSNGTILHRASSYSISGNAPFFNLTREGNTIYIRNISSGSVDPGTIRVDLIYIMTN